ncbi:MAG: hypothetical protein JXA28_13365 [Bacteroidetes bacterium]|nr:hypothetical protein [Bacteroidota bacterium]
MNASNSWAYCALPIRFLCIVLTALFLFAACSDPQAEAPEIPSSYLAMRKSDIVYGPINDRNPFEHVGLRHNDLVHAVIASAQAWDTLDISHMFGRIQNSAAEWAEDQMGLSPDRSLELVQAAFALKIDSTAPQRLAQYRSPALTVRERDYIQRIGELLCRKQRFADAEAGLLALEREILAESWPAGDSTETAARIVISVAKHSFAYWKRMMCTVYDIENGDRALGKSATDLIIYATSRTQIIVAADAIGAWVAFENTTPLGLGAQFEAAIITGGSLSLVVAVIVYWKEIVEFLDSLLPWNW